MISSCLSGPNKVDQTKSTRLTHVNVSPCTHTHYSLTAAGGTCTQLRNIQDINCICVREKERELNNCETFESFSYFSKMRQTGWHSPCSEDSLSRGDVSPSSSTSCPLPCGILAPDCCKQAADPGLFFLSLLTATGSCLFQHPCVPLSPLVAGKDSKTQSFPCIHDFILYLKTRHVLWLHWKDIMDLMDNGHNGKSP